MGTGISLRRLWLSPKARGLAGKKAWAGEAGGSAPAKLSGESLKNPLRHPAQDAVIYWG